MRSGRSLAGDEGTEGGLHSEWCHGADSCQEPKDLWSRGAERNLVPVAPNERPSIARQTACGDNRTSVLAAAE